MSGYDADVLQSGIYIGSNIIHGPGGSWYMIICSRDDKNKVIIQLAVEIFSGQLSERYFVDSWSNWVVIK